jgi:hypothetical protein
MADVEGGFTNKMKFFSNSTVFDIPIAIGTD